MRILFFGTSDFAVPVLDALIASGEHEVLSVVTQPDKPKGRGQRVAYSPVKHAALGYGLPVLQPRRVRAASFLEIARDLAPDALVLASFGQIIPQELLDLPPNGPINVHGSLLPAYRGAAPIQYAILNGETETGVTTMWMEATLDTGDILLQRACPIAEDDTTSALTPKLAAIGAQLTLETLGLLAEGRCPRIPQNEELATYAPSIKPEESVVRWTDSAVNIRNRIRALSPRPGVFTAHRGRRIKLWAARVEQDRLGFKHPDNRVEKSWERIAEVPEQKAGEPGVVRGVLKDAVEVFTGDGILALAEVQAEGAKRMRAADWARGARIAPGERFEVG